MVKQLPAEPRYADRRGRRILSDARLVEIYRGRIERLARRHSYDHLPGLDEDDLKQNAFLAMLRLRRRYDPSRKVPFGAYLSQRAAGAMIDSVRAEARQSKRDRMMDGWSKTSKGQPAIMEDISPLDHLLAREDNQEAKARLQRIRATLNEAARRSLTPRQCRVLGLLYFKGLTLKQAGKIIGVCESRMSQIHAQILQQLRSHLALHGWRSSDRVG